MADAIGAARRVGASDDLRVADGGAIAVDVSGVGEIVAVVEPAVEDDRRV